jgi:hypothetical protein
MMPGSWSGDGPAAAELNVTSPCWAHRLAQGLVSSRLLLIRQAAAPRGLYLKLCWERLSGICAFGYISRPAAAFARAEGKYRTIRMDAFPTRASPSNMRHMAFTSPKEPTGIQLNIPVKLCLPHIEAYSASDREQAI